MALPKMIRLTVPISDIEVEDRFRKDYGDIEELKKEIETNGLMHNLVCDKGENGKPYHLCAGGRRLLCVTELGWTEVPIAYYDGVLTPHQRRIVELHENIRRKNMTWQEEDALTAEIHRSYVEEYGEKKHHAQQGWSQVDTADLMGVDRSEVSRAIKLSTAMDIMPEIRTAKTRDDAMKILKKAEEQVLMHELAQRIEAKKASTPLEQQRKAIIDSYMVGDFFKGVKDVPDRSVNLVEIDPPYGIDLPDIKDSGAEITMGYNEIPSSAYLEFIRRTVKESVRCLANDGWLIMWYAPEPWAEPVYQILRDAGLSLTRVPAIWFKGASNEEGGAAKVGGGQTRNPHIRLGSIYEPFYYCRKGNAVINLQGHSNVYQYSPVPDKRKIHPTERPLPMIMDVLNTFSIKGHRVMVPFLGSGKTLLAANNLGMESFGWDLCRDYKERFIMKVYAGEPARFHDGQE